jgi:beta-galactosidase
VLNQDNESGSVSVSMKVSATDSQNVTAGFILKDREENILVEKSLQLNKENNHLEGTICVDLESVRLWDNHNPYLYHAYVELKAEDGSLAEVIPYDIGFRRIEIIDKVVYLNGKRLVITGVNRHEWNARTGRCIGIEDMKADISCMLRNNINSVRTCHYPDQIPWYYMCDDAGIYVMAETNLESHGSFQKLGAIEPSCNVPGSIPQWRDAVLERAKNNFETFKNHTSILFWSLGNESYAGDDIEAMNVYFAEKKDGRLVHYESAYYNRAYEDTISDFETRMYAKPEDVEEYLNNSPKFSSIPAVFSGAASSAFFLPAIFIPFSPVCCFSYPSQAPLHNHLLHKYGPDHRLLPALQILWLLLTLFVRNRIRRLTSLTEINLLTGWHLTPDGASVNSAFPSWNCSDVLPAFLTVFCFLLTPL